METKFVSLKSLKVEDAGSGTISGYRSVFNVIDEGGDIVLPGAFKDCISEYLDSGFTAHSHDWAFKEVVGFPIESYEDDHGWFVKSQFHSTPDAQAIRTKAKERMDAGKQVGFSFGYAPTEFSHVEAKDYEKELPKYVKADALTAMMEKAQKFNRIRILKKVDAIEDSLVTAPMNKRAAATAIKSATQIEIVDEEVTKPDELKLTFKLKTELQKGMLAEEMAQTTPSIWEVESAFHRVVRKIAETAKNITAIDTPFDWQAKVGELTAEYGPRLQPIIINQITEYLDGSDDEFYLKGITGTESFESFEDAGAALTEFAKQMRSNHEIRVKEGRVLSSSNRAKVQACRDSMTALITDLDNLLTLSEPKPKEKDLNVDALRTQSLRAQSQAMLALLP